MSVFFAKHNLIRDAITRVLNSFQIAYKTKEVGKLTAVRHKNIPDMLFRSTRKIPRGSAVFERFPYRKGKRVGRVAERRSYEMGGSKHTPLRKLIDVVGKIEPPFA